MTYDDMPQKGFEPASGDPGHIDAISDHIERYVGPIKSVFHEIVSDKVHVDVYWVEPSEEQPFHVLVTSGMSERPMNVPEGLEDYRFAELCILLPPDWPLDMESFKNEDNYWPVRWLKELARFPHEYDTYFFMEHTIGGEDSEPFSPNCPFTGFLIFVPPSLDEGFITTQSENGDTIFFYCLIPLYKEEIDLKMNRGMDELLDLFEKNDVSDIVDVERPNLC